MRQLFADFARLEERPNLGLSILLGRADLSPELAVLQDGERVLLVEPGELYAPAIMLLIEVQDYLFWYAVLESRAAIHDLEPGQPAPAQV